MTLLSEMKRIAEYYNITTVYVEYKDNSIRTYQKDRNGEEYDLRR